MSKNIEDIVESVLPEQVYETVDDLNNGDQCERALYGYDFAQSQLKQALTEKKLVVPMSEEEIKILVGCEFNTYPKAVIRLAKKLYERQFKGDE